jgi:uncharacterized protein (DUF1800 family)
LPAILPIPAGIESPFEEWSMARDPQAALVALNRFGFGARGGASGDLVNAASDPRGYVRAELMRPNGALLELPGLQPTPELGRAMFAYQDEVKAAREAAAKVAAMPPASDAMKPAEPMAMGQTTTTAQSDAPKPPPAPPNVVQTTFRNEALARIQRATITEGGFVERLVTFWSNHFCISASKGEPARIWAGSFEREAIRPHVLGRFADMLTAVEQHPAMLFFLDNQQSIGPDSRAGQNRKRGLNENLAREIMELHTLGVGGGYTQADVTTLAAIITGWTFVGRQGRLGPPGSFAFNGNAHQPGPQTLLGKSYDDTGVAQGEAALAELARHPSTAKFIARKFAAHFVADTPPQALVAKLEATFRSSDGDLRKLSMALLDADEAWQAPLGKMRTPYDYLIATNRLLGRIPDNPGAVLGGLNTLGQPLWTPAGPNGFADSNAAWAAPEGIKLRLDMAAQVSAKIADSIDARDLLEVMAGDAASIETRQTIARAETRQQALALLLMSPEFQRR